MPIEKAKLSFIQLIIQMYSKLDLRLQFFKFHISYLIPSRPCDEAFFEASYSR